MAAGGLPHPALDSPESPSGEAAKTAVAVAPYVGELPEFARQTPAVEALYRWVAPNRAIMQYFQCTCGCELEAGHKSNWNCYVREEKPGGEYIWDPMSAG